jgi:hypothetical protein
MIEFAASWSAKAIVGTRTACKICGTESSLFDVVDFHEGCHEADGSHMPLSGIPVYYYCCPGCGFLFTPQLDGRDVADLLGPLPIDHPLIDPLLIDSPASPAESAERSGLIERRARSYLTLLYSWFGKELGALRILVLGNASLPALLREAGCAADGRNPAESVAEAFSTDPDVRYDMILVLDIIEQIAAPLSLMQAIDRLMVPDGLLLLSTRLNDGSDMMSAGPRHRPLRYVSPRMGQISIYNASSLALVLGTAGFRLAGTRQGIHIGLRALPSFGRHLFLGWMGGWAAGNPFGPPAMLAPSRPPKPAGKK